MMYLGPHTTGVRNGRETTLTITITIYKLTNKGRDTYAQGLKAMNQAGTGISPEAETEPMRNYTPINDYY